MRAMRLLHVHGVPYTYPKSQGPIYIVLYEIFIILEYDVEQGGS